MRALVYHRTGPAPDVLTIEDRPRPDPGPGEVRVRIHASGVNPHDTKFRSGWTGGMPDGASIVPHSDGAGVIEAVGPGVDPARIGARVFVLNAPHGAGTAAEAVILPDSHAPALAEGFSFAEGACLGVPAYTAWLAVLGDGPVEGQVVLVQGGGGAVGRVAVELASLSGAIVIATGRSGRSRAVAGARGARLVLPVESAMVTEAVMDLSQGRGAARIVEVDFAANQATNAAAIAPHGTLAAYSCSSDRTPMLDYYAFARKAARLSFVQGLALTDAERSAATAALSAHFARGALRPDIAATFPLAQAAAAHLAVEAGAPANVVVTLD
ncbi:alcohol dehydrogenase catalytic domain-containing protein [Marinibacterium sp. SX1]|uniref:alcohol dehydrogenase catalytic domain-containing protein n=1 Tax=Marinibacterium sp. SX1 TaxID=3388424 RepID=UPI003D174B04